MAACKVLIIDDDEDGITFLTDALAKSGIESGQHVYSAGQAFWCLEGTTSECLPKLIITDQYLPDISGAEFLKELKEMYRYKNIPVIMLAAHKTPAETEKYRALGAEAYLLKPSTYQEYIALAADMKHQVEV